MKRAHAQGMSLIELLLALMLGALLMTLLNGVLSSVQTGWSRSTAAATASADELEFARFLFASVAQAIPPDPLDQNTWFHGTSERIEFLAPAPAAESARGPVKMHLYSRLRKGGQKELVVELRPLALPSGFTPGASARILIGGLESVSFNFSGSAPPLQKLNAWGDPRTLPQVVGVHITFLPGRAPPLRLAISPRRTVSGRCVFDLVSLSCRA